MTIKHALISVAVLLLTACNTIIQQPPPSQLYSLRPLQDLSEQSQSLPVNIIVSRPLTSPGLERELIPLIKPNHELSYYSLARWSAPTPDLVRYFLIDSLQNQNIFQSVTPDNRFGRNNYRLDAHIQNFQAEYEGESAAPTIHVKIAFTLTNLAKRTPVATFVESYQITVDNNRMSDVVEGFQQAMNQATTEALARISTALAQNQNQNQNQ